MRPEELACEEARRRGLAGAFTDQAGHAAASTGPFLEDPSTMFSLGNTLAVLLKVAGQTPSDLGNYTVSLDPATLRQ